MTERPHEDQPGYCDPRWWLALYTVVVIAAGVGFVRLVLDNPKVLAKCPREVDAYYLSAMKVNERGEEYDCHYVKRGPFR